MAKCRKDNVPPQPRGEDPGADHPAFDGVRTTEEQRAAIIQAAKEQDPSKMGSLLEGEHDVFATAAAERGHEGFENVIHSLSEMFGDLDPQRASNLATIPDVVVSERAATTIRKIYADADPNVAGQAEAMIRYAGHIAGNTETLPSAIRAINAMVDTHYKSTLSLARMIDGGQADIFTRALYVIRSDTFVNIEGARKGIKSDTARSLRSLRQNLDGSDDLARVMDEQIDDSLKALDLPGTTEENEKALEIWAAAVKAGAPDNAKAAAAKLPVPGSTRKRGNVDKGAKGRKKSTGPGILRESNPLKSSTAAIDNPPLPGRSSGKPRGAPLQGPKELPFQGPREAPIQGPRNAPHQGPKVPRSPSASRKGLSRKEAQDVVASAGGEDAINASATMFSSMDESRVAAAADLLRGTGKARLTNMFMEYWVNGILSGPITHAVNLGVNQLINVYRPLEKVAIGGVYSDKQIYQEGIDMLHELATAYKAAFRMNGAAGRLAVKQSVRLKRQALRAKKLKSTINDPLGVGGRRALEQEADRVLNDAGVGPVAKAFLTGEEQTVKGARQFDDPRANRAITGANAGFDQGSVGAQLVDALGTIVNLPGRMLSTADELGKAVNYRMHLAAISKRHALSASPDGVTRSFEQLMDAAPRHHQIAASRPNHGPTQAYAEQLKTIHEQSQQYAKSATFTDALGEGNSKRLQDARNHSALVQFAVPFVRTPVNLIKFVGERTPFLRKASKRVMEELNSGDPARVRVAQGKMYIGTGLWLGAGIAAQEGKITGGGPQNFDERNVLLAAGWQPYSVRWVGEDGKVTYTAFNRVDPIGMFLGISADLVEAMGMMGEEEVTQVAMGGMAAVMSSLTSKTYFQGISALIDSISNPDTALGPYMEKNLSSLVPNFFAQTARNDLFGIGEITGLAEADRGIHEVAGLLERLRSRLPGFSKDLAPRRNIYGEPVVYPPGYGPDTISPFFQKTESESPAAKEAGRLAQMGLFSFNMRRAYGKIKGVELTNEQKDKYIVLASQDLSRNGRTLQSALDRLVQSRKYRAAADVREGGRPSMIRSLISKRIRRAEKEMLRRDPELRELVQALEVQQRLDRRSGSLDDILSNLRVGN